MSKQDLKLQEVARRTAHLIRGMMVFWKEAHGWAPIDAAALLNKSMLEWQSSLADSLEKWACELDDGELILAWANIGALVEGQLKLYLSVYYQDYVSNVDAAITDQSGSVVDPDGVTLEPLRVFFEKNVWTSSESWDKWIRLVQARRNAIHAFKAKSIGDSAELHESLRILLDFAASINERLPYPDGVYVPRQY